MVRTERLAPMTTLSPSSDAAAAAAAQQLAFRKGRRVLDSSDIGFAVVELLELDVHPFLEVLLTARERSPTNEQATQLLLFLQRVLDSDQAANGFGLTYDFRLLQNPSVKVLLTIAKWGAVPERQALFLQRCIASKRACLADGSSQQQRRQ